jgi:hypothetical protein
MGRPGYPLEFEVTENGCKVPIGFKLNQDGYFRKRVNNKLVMYHRYSYEQEVGVIPEGMEVDHKCKNRACCNVEHLQLLGKSEHRSKDNEGRYQHKVEEAKEVVSRNPTKSMMWVAEQIGMSFSSVYRWRKEGLI